MHVLVAVKQVIDPNSRVVIGSGGKDLNINKLDKIINPYDRVALEEALNLRDLGLANKITVVSVSKSKQHNVLFECLALGADNAVNIIGCEELSSLNVAKLLAEFSNEIKPNLILCGARAIDTDAGVTGSILSNILGWPEMVNVSKITVAEEKVMVESNIGNYCELLSASLPVVVTVDLKCNNPRLLNINNIAALEYDKVSTIVIKDSFRNDFIPKSFSYSNDERECKFINIDDLVSIIDAEGVT